MLAVALCLSGSVLAVGTSVADVGTEVGVPTTYVGHAYASTTAPTADKPQSKLWYLDGAWWALMVQAGGTRVTVHELMPDHTWRDTGAVVDSRAESTGDALWSARDAMLYVASRAPGSNLRVAAFSYDASTRSWTGASGYPVTLASGGTSESATIDQDSLGRLWVTYTRASRVWVAHSDATGQTWTGGFQPSVPDTTIKSDDLSSLIAFGDQVGVLYSDQESGGFHFAIHEDGDPDDVWRSEAILDLPFMADDHLNLKQLVGDPQGQIFAAIKTSANVAPDATGSDPLVGVLTRTPRSDGSGSWAFAPAGTVADDHTRPLIMIDATNRQLYFFATASATGGDIVYYKSAPLSDIDFGTGAGRGTPFVDAPSAVSNASGSKDPVTQATGMVLLAVTHGSKRYVHAEMRLRGDAPSIVRKVPDVAATGVAPSAEVSVTFSEPVQGVSSSTFVLSDGDGDVVPAALSELSGDRWVLDPDVDLELSTTYHVQLTGGAGAITDLEGNGLLPDTVGWSFTTAAFVGDGVPPEVKGMVPADDATKVSTGATVSATFTEAVQGVDTGTFRLVDTATGEAVTATVSRKGTTNTWLLDPAAGLATDRRYTVRLVGGASGVRDLKDTPLESVSWTFLTGPAPKVSSKSPKSRATGVSRSTVVTATFSEPVDGVDGTTFRLTDPDGAVVEADVRRDGTTNKWVLDPVPTLPPVTRLTVTLTGGRSAIRDLAGNPLTTTVWSFTTG